MDERGAAEPRAAVPGRRLPGRLHGLGLDGQEQALKDGLRPGDGGFGEVPRESWGSVSAGEDSRTVETLAGDYAGFYRALGAAVRGEGPVPVDPADAVGTLEIIERALELV
ncbi:hypothetical protein [Corynebacterium sp.]|uniref:hypothetical protein n=1 Tax=Corynebacterium sp. TaxID=1720 RepID=UPI0025BC5824|nr:hypothetical protein [Corynebacterium sp.]